MWRIEISLFKERRDFECVGSGEAIDSAGALEKVGRCFPRSNDHRDELLEGAPGHVCVVFHGATTGNDHADG
jgi:hypothetical protein